MGAWVTGGTSVLCSALVPFSTTKQLVWEGGVMGVMLQIRPWWPRQ